MVVHLNLSLSGGPPRIRHPIQEKLAYITIHHATLGDHIAIIMKLRVIPQAGNDTHVYFIPAHQLKPDILDSNKSLLRVGHCTVHVGPLAGIGLHAVTLRCHRGTPGFERRQALRSFGVVLPRPSSEPV